LPRCSARNGDATAGRQRTGCRERFGKRRRHRQPGDRPFQRGRRGRPAPRLGLEVRQLQDRLARRMQHLREVLVERAADHNGSALHFFSVCSGRVGSRRGRWVQPHRSSSLPRLSIGELHSPYNCQTWLREPTPFPGTFLRSCVLAGACTIFLIADITKIIEGEQAGHVSVQPIPSISIVRYAPCALAPYRTGAAFLLPDWH
jgi:hypothetical protein